MGLLTEFPESLGEETTQVYQATIKDEDDLAVPGAQVGALTLTLFNEGTGEIINGRDHQDVLQTNGGTWDSAGILKMIFEPEDTVIMNDALAFERRHALFEWTYSSGARSGRHEIVFHIRNLEQQVPPAS